MLPKQYRLKKRLAFKATYKVKNSSHSGGVTLFAGIEKKEEVQTKVGFVVSKKVHKRAVKRNRLKRLMRESYRQLLKENNLYNSDKYLSLIFVGGENALGKKFDSHPTGGSFSSTKFDFMDDVKLLVKNAAQRFPHFRLIGWDIAIDENNKPLIIEANLTMSGMDVIETIGGPLFGEYTDKVLEEVFLKKHKKKTTMDIIQYV